MSVDPRLPATTTNGGALTRRTFLGAAAAGAGGLLLSGAGLGRAGAASAATSALPVPAASGIDHVVVLMMENRSFDHFLGWLPGANGRQGGLSYLDRAGQRHPTYHQTTYQGCADNDPDHSYIGGRVEYNGGHCDGWLWAGNNDPFCIGYYRASDLAFYRARRPLLDRLRPLLRRDPGAHLPQPALHALGPDRPDRRHHHCLDPADHLGLAGRGRRQPQLLLLRRSLHRAVGHQIPPDLPAVRPVPGRLPGRAVAGGELPRPAVRGRGQRDIGRRPSPRRHPGGPVVHQPGVRGRHRQPGVGPDGLRHHLRRMGRVLRSRALRRSLPTPIRPTGCAASGCRRS